MIWVILLKSYQVIYSFKVRHAKNVQMVINEKLDFILESVLNVIAMENLIVVTSTQELVWYVRNLFIISIR